MCADTKSLEFKRNCDPGGTMNLAQVRSRPGRRHLRHDMHG